MAGADARSSLTSESEPERGQVAPRPAAIRVLSVLYVLSALVMGGYAGFALMRGDETQWPFPFPPAALLPAALWIGVTGAGLSRRARWARLSAIAFHATVCAAMGAVVVRHYTGAASLGPDFSLVRFLIKIGIHVLLLAYWRAKHVRAYFAA
jgi:hypothetical protein